MIRLFIAIALLLLGCQKVEKTKIRVACDQTIEVSSGGMSVLSARNHHAAPTRCPGFFAELEDDSLFATAQKKRRDVKDCGESSPLRTSEDVRASLSRNKRKVIRALKSELDDDIMNGFAADMSRPKSQGGMWDTRFHNLPDANKVAEWLQNQIESFGPSKVEIAPIVHANTPQHSLEAILRPKAPSDKYLILGAHLDSTNRDDKSFAPGANDNASGSAVLLEVLRVLIRENFQPRVNVVFYWYAAEEVGLVGSQEIARSYAEDQKNVIGVMNLDLAFYTPSNPRNIYLISDYTDKTLTARIDFLADEMGYRPRSVRCGYACSDHGSWSQYGFPAFFARDANSASGFRRIHTPRDVLDDKLSAKYALRFAVLALAYVVDFGT